MKLYNEYLNDFLTEVTSDEKYERQYKNKIDREEFDLAVKLDPTSKGTEKVGKYVDWIIKNKITDEKVTDLLDKFTQFKHKIDPSKRDINKVNLEDLEEVINSLDNSSLSKTEKKSEDRVKAEEESKLVKKTDQYIVISPETEFASQFFGAGSDWCTARRDSGRCMFNTYARDGEIYIIKRIKDNEKFQIWVSNDTRSEAKDIANRDFNPREEFIDDEEMIEWLDNVGYKDNSILTDEQINEIAFDVIQDLNLEDFEFKNDASDIIKNSLESIDQLGYDDPQFNAFEYAKDYVSEWSYYFDMSMKLLQDKYDIDINSDKNKLNVLSSLVFNGQAIIYNIENGNKPFDEEGMSDGSWEYIHEKDLKGLMKSFEDIDDFDDQIEIIAKWLPKIYHKDFNDFDNFYRVFTSEFEIDDEEKEELKDLIDKIKNVEYGKSGHPKLDLQSLSIKLANRYIMGE